MLRVKGLTLVEVLVTIAVLGIALSIAALNLRPFYDPLSDGLTRTEGLLKQVRAKAMATTSAYKLSLSGNEWTAARAGTCRSTSFSADPSLNLKLPEGVTASISPSGASLCFTSRGLLVILGGSGSGEPVITLRDNKGRTKSLKVLLGGGVLRQ